MNVLETFGAIFLLLLGLFGWFIFSAWLLTWIEKHYLNGGE